MSTTLDECVICLQAITERAVAVPCNHLAFDFICLASWLQENPQCPLCKTELTSIQYDFRAPHDFKTYVVPSITKPKSPPQSPLQRGSRFPSRLSRFRIHGQAPRRPRADLPTPTPDAAIQRRRYVYREQLYSLHVGSNRLSRFKDFTPLAFDRSPELQGRGRKWIRRELQVFDFLSPDSPSSASTAASRRRADNAEFLLLYIISILKTVDIKGSSGKAEEMLEAYLGKDNTRLFLHELGAWLRSPFNSLEDWDRAVQYCRPLPSFPDDGKPSVSGDPLFSTYHASSEPSHGATRRTNDASQYSDLSWRQQQARRRYEPD